MCTLGCGVRFFFLVSDGYVWVWQIPGESDLSDCIVPTLKFGDVNKESSELMQEDFRRQKYILSRGLVNLTHIVEPRMSNIVHKKQYRSTKPWLEDWCWKTYQFPTSSGLTPTEHRQHHPAPVSNLTNTLLDKWAKIPTYTLKNLVKCLTRKWKLS